MSNATLKASLTALHNQPLGENVSPQKQVKSRQRVADHGEVFTNEREVNAMLDLVKDQTTNPEKTFLEPACGNGNFLAAILMRKLTAIGEKHRKIQLDYERNAIIAVSSLYGIELLPDNVNECRKRLFNIFCEHYQTTFPTSYKAQCLHTAELIFSKNILCGDALSFKTVEGTDIVFSEWKMIGNRIKRRDYVYPDLVHQVNSRDLPLYSDLGNEAYIPDAIRDYPLTHFLELAND